ncbi:hypothetical protein TRVL_02893 [Trypanosoma vivax]|nr:hypothetical protein TRVL_02893 [Trypanosoma vivax]
MQSEGTRPVLYSQSDVQIQEEDVSLFAESHVHNNNLPSIRPTTYLPTYVDSPPPLRGTLYMQNPSDTLYESDDLNVCEMTLPQLYSALYISYMQKQKADKKMILYHGPPDIEGEQLPSAEDTSRYINETSLLCADGPEEPSPYRLYETLVTQFIERTALAKKDDSNENRDNAMNEDEFPSPSTRGEGDKARWFVSLFQSVNPETEVLVHTMSMWLSSIHDLTGLNVVIDEARRCPVAMCALTPAVVSDALEASAELLKGGGCTHQRRVELCSLLGLIVLPRGNIQEILKYVFVLQRCCGDSIHSIMPMILPHYEEVLQSFALSSPSQRSMVSPVDAITVSVRCCLSCCLRRQLSSSSVSHHATVYWLWQPHLVWTCWRQTPGGCWHDAQIQAWCKLYG